MVAAELVLSQEETAVQPPAITPLLEIWEVRAPSTVSVLSGSNNAADLQDNLVSGLEVADGAAASLVMVVDGWVGEVDHPITALIDPCYSAPT